MKQTHLILALAIPAGLVLAVFVFRDTAVADSLFEMFSRERLTALIDWADPFGPIVIVAGMTVAVVVSPIPSAPIALVGVVCGRGRGATLSASG